MIYVDTSVILSMVFVEDRQPPTDFWSRDLVSSRLLQYEAWTRLNARGLFESHADVLRASLEEVTFIEMSDAALERALDPLPVSLRTLDALHLATMHFLKQQGLPVRLASYDSRLLAAAQAIGIDTLAL
jgi:predicted nucleic acid-binding protein